jgi:hypothetical protein
MRVVLEPRAAKQVAALPAVAARKVVETLTLLARVPHLGVLILQDEVPYEVYRKVVRVRRRWTCSITYRIVGEEVVVLYVDPGWLRRGR